MPQVNAPIRYYLAFRNMRWEAESSRTTAYATFLDGNGGSPDWVCLHFKPEHGTKLSYSNAIAAHAKALERWGTQYDPESFFIIPEDLAVFR